MRLLSKRPWLIVVFAFIVLIAAWVKLYVFAKNHGDVPISVPDETSP